MRTLLAILVLLLSGCTSDPAAHPDAAPDEHPDDAPAAHPGPASDDAPAAFEPLVYEGAVTGGLDCLAEGNVDDYDPLTGDLIQLPPEAGRRTFLLELLPVVPVIELTATCLLFSDGTLHSDAEGRVPRDVTWVQVVTNGNVEKGYRLTIG